MALRKARADFVPLKEAFASIVNVARTHSAESIAVRSVLRLGGHREDGERNFTYGDLVSHSAAMASNILQESKLNTLKGKRVAFITSPEYLHVASQWGIWTAGATAVPLCISHPRDEIEYVLEDSKPSAIVADEKYFDRVKDSATQLGIPLIRLDEHKWDSLQRGDRLEPVDVDPSEGSHIIYTSGTTSRPKGVLTTFGNFHAQVTSLNQAWEWTSADSTLNILPLHHVHGMVNVVSCSLWSGAKLRMSESFNAKDVWEVLATGGDKADPLTFFSAVPTVYAKLLEYYDGLDDRDEQIRLSEGVARLRLMISGSAALPLPILHRWKDITRHTLLERYGMTEIGMALSNPLHGKRLEGSVGTPLPGVSVALANAEDQEGGCVTGELLVKGPAVFSEYLNKPEATADSFTEEGYFATGDIVEESPEGRFRILGRASADIIKSGGYKLSALEIEHALLAHPDLAELAIFGMDDPSWGERVTGVAVVKGDLNLEKLRAFGKDKLAPYKLPTELILVDEIPKNAMGKVNKKALKAHYSSST